jgi:hypothetical protein
MEVIVLQERMGAKPQALPDCLNSQENSRNIKEG